MTCEYCRDTGWYAYDHNHSKVCEHCCKHNEGWWKLTEHHVGYVKDANNMCCIAGCGTMLRDIKEDSNE